MADSELEFNTTCKFSHPTPMNGIVLIRNLEASEKLLYTLLDQHQKARQKTNCLSILLILPDPFIQQARLAQLGER